MSEAKPNPFDPPSGPTTAVTGTTGRLQYFQAYQYVFGSPNWVVNLLLVTVCQLIPIIGPMVMLGYQFQIVEALHREPHRIYPDFDFDNFVDYLKRGLWPFLVSLVVMLVIGVPMMILMGIVFFVAHSVGGDGGPVVGIIGVPLTLMILMAAMLTLGVIMMPMVLRAGLAQDFGEAFKLDFVKSFISRTWKEIFLSALFMMVTGMVLAFFGLLLCIVGSYVATSLMMLAQAHIYFQLYELFLARGGEPIPLAPPANSAG